MKKNAKADKKKLTLVRDVPLVKESNLYPNGVEVRINGKFAAWLAELPTRCCC
jgi:hypothetical protein